MLYCRIIDLFKKALIIIYIFLLIIFLLKFSTLIITASDLKTTVRESFTNCPGISSLHTTSLFTFSTSPYISRLRPRFFSHFHELFSPLPLKVPKLFQPLLLRPLHLTLACSARISKYVNPQTTAMTAAKMCRFVEEGRMDCMPNTDVTKLAGRKSIDTSVRMRIFWPWVTVVRASRTADALKSWNNDGS